MLEYWLGGCGNNSLVTDPQFTTLVMLCVALPNSQNPTTALHLKFSKRLFTTIYEIVGDTGHILIYLYLKDIYININK